MSGYTIQKNTIIISDREFDAKATLECGQVFRFESFDGGYKVFSGNKCALAVVSRDGWEIDTDNPEYFADYFDLERDYGGMRSQIRAEGFLARAVEFGKGIRILRQDSYEALISFIISANNNIGRIQTIIRRLCERAGEKTAYGYAFPTLDALNGRDAAFYADIGCGYRSGYLAETVKALQTADFAVLAEMPTAELKKYLKAFKGVGEKVASCVLLYGFNRWDIFPVDTWIFKVFNEYYREEPRQAAGDIPESSVSETEEKACRRSMMRSLKEEYAPTPDDASRYFSQRFKNLSGLVQQYMFYYRRSGKSGE